MDIQNFMQKKDGWCGPASLAYAMDQQGVQQDQESLAKQTNTTVAGGVDPYPLEKAAKKNGMETLVLKGKPAGETLNLIKSYIKNKWSAIIDFLDGRSEDDGHYSVVLEINDHAIKIFDPAEGKGIREISLGSFKDHWLDYKKDGQEFRHYALLLTKDHGRT